MRHTLSVYFLSIVHKSKKHVTHCKPNKVIPPHKNCVQFYNSVSFSFIIYYDIK